MTLVGDAAHPTSPYAAYGAGMSIEDGYFLASRARADRRPRPGAVRGALQAFEDRRKPHTARVTEQAYMHGRHVPPLPRRCARFATSSTTTRRCCRRSSASRRPTTSSPSWPRSRSRKHHWPPGPADVSMTRFHRGDAPGLCRQARALELGDVVAIPMADASRLGAPYAQVLRAPRAHASLATPFLGIVGVVVVEVRAVGGNGARMSCTWPGRAKLRVIRRAATSGE